MIAEAMLSPRLDGISRKKKQFACEPTTGCKAVHRNAKAARTFADIIGIAPNASPARTKQQAGIRDRHVNACRIGVVANSLRHRRVGLRRRAADRQRFLPL
jgi:hypothetical protein